MDLDHGLDDEPVAWIWDDHQRCYVLPRRCRLPKRQRRLARQSLRT